jgi:hypothetical protein
LNLKNQSFALCSKPFPRLKELHNQYIFLARYLNAFLILIGSVRLPLNHIEGAYIRVILHLPASKIIASFQFRPYIQNLSKNYHRIESQEH